MRKVLAMLVCVTAFTAWGSDADAQRTSGAEKKPNVYGRATCHKIADERGFTRNSKSGRGKFIRACRQGRVPMR